MDLIRKLNITHKLSLLQFFVKHRILLSTASQTVHDLRRNPCIHEPRTVEVMATPILVIIDTSTVDAHVGLQHQP